MIVGATALQIAAPSIAEMSGIPYVFAAYCPAVLPSPQHAPPVLSMLGDKPVNMSDYRELWGKDAQRWNDQWSLPLNAHRARHGLGHVDDVRGHVLTRHPWLACDPALGPWPDPADGSVFQTGAWFVEDDRPFSPELEAFLDAGDPPIYFGFGSMRASQHLSEMMVQSARALGRRAILLRGWADLSLADNEPDCIAIGEVNHQALFKRVAAVVHHGGAGTTHTAARSGAPQVILPQMYDQHYWAGRIQQLGLGSTLTTTAPSADLLMGALRQALQPEVAARAQTMATQVRDDGTRVAARRLINGT
jgi:vancomycin aglycone glucosyltransferase